MYLLLVDRAVPNIHFVFIFGRVIYLFEYLQVTNVLNMQIRQNSVIVFKSIQKLRVKVIKD